MTTWNPSDKSAAINLSNGNLTAGLSSSTNSGARGTTSHSSGKWYLEFNTNNIQGAGIIGIANSTYNYANNSGDATNSAGVDEPGNMQSPNGGTTSTAANGKTVGLAVDFGAGVFWITYDGSTWYGFGASTSSNPATGSNGEGLGTGLISGASAFPVVRLQNNGDHVTLNTGPTGFAFAVPSGFTPWDPPVFTRAAFGTVIA